MIVLVQHINDFQFSVHPGGGVGRLIRNPLPSVVLDGRFADFLQAAINLILKKVRSARF